MRRSEANTVQDNAFEEARRLFEDLRFSAARGNCALGDHVAVTVDPTRESEAVMRVDILCHAFERWLVDWTGVPVFLENERGDTWVADLDRWGRHIIRVPPAEYSLSAWPGPPVGCLAGLPAATFNGQPLASNMMLLLGEQQTPVAKPWKREWRSQDGSLEITAKEVPPEVHITFKTRDERLAEVTVKFVMFRSDTKEKVCGGEVQLRQVAGQRCWQWTWPEARPLPADCDLICDVLPRQ